MDEQVYRYVHQSCNSEETFHFLGFEFLQRMNIVRLQNKIAASKSLMHDGQFTDEEELHTTLTRYIDAVRNYSFTHAQPAVPPDEINARYLRLTRHFSDLNDRSKPFDSHYYYAGHASPPTDSVRSYLRSVLPARLTYSHAEQKSRAKEFSEGRPAIGISNFVDRLARLLVAFTGGAFLLVPMLIMVLNGQTTEKSVITTSVAVLLFATALTFGARATNVETMVSTATYAAVLVVFVGTNSGPSTSS